MRQNALIRQLLTPLKGSPLHPQWFVYKNEQDALRELGQQVRGLTLDIGAGTQAVRRYLSDECRYVSLDYYKTAVNWYDTRPQLYGDGQQLPIRAESIDTALLLDVLEHLPQPEMCVAEIWRVLRPGGTFIVRVPFLYPLHDAPYDFHRWTIYGLQALAQRHQFEVKSEVIRGHPLESAALLANLSLSKTALNWFRAKNPLFLLSPLLLFVMFAQNVGAWLLARLSGNESFMPHSYRMVWKKIA
jgi:SAM-dependent methyltransferase